MTLSLAQLREDLESLPAYSPHLPTNIIALRHECGEILAELDGSTEEDLRKELEQANESLEEANQQTTEAEKRAVTAEEENLKILNEMHALKDPSADGESVTSYRNRALAAEAKTEQYCQFMRDARQHVEQAEAETKALRARKGITAGVFRNVHKITGLLSRIAHTMGHNQQDEAAALLKEIQS